MGSARMTYRRGKPSGARSAFWIRSWATGPTAAETLPDTTERSTKSERDHIITVTQEKEKIWIKAWGA